jgi:ribonucleoside-diphosphate reductase alpha chain
MEAVVAEACAGLEAVDGRLILDEARRNLFDGVAEKDVGTALVMSARVLIEKEPNYSQVTARLLMDTVRREALTFIAGLPQDATQAEMAGRYAEYFKTYVKRGAELELLDGELTRYDLERLGAALKPERDLQFTYLGLQTLYDRYFIHSGGTRFELPQAFFMRVAMGLAINEIDREGRAIEFYNLLSSFDFMSSTPTCSTPAPCARSSPAATSPRCPMIWTASLAPSRTTPCCPSLPAVLATTGPACAAWAPTSRAPTARARAWCRS